MGKRGGLLRKFFAAILLLTLWLHSVNNVLAEVAKGPETMNTISNDEEPVQPGWGGHWAGEAFAALAKMNALPAQWTQFDPDSPISRGEFVYILMKAKGIVPKNTSSSSFIDVKTDAWYYPYVEAAYQMAITDGTSRDAKHNHFYPDRPLLRQAMLAMLVRAKGDFWRVPKLFWFGSKGQYPGPYNYAQVTKLLAPYADGRAMPDWAKLYFAHALAKGFVNGVNAGGKSYLKPRRAATKAEAALLVYRMIVPDGKAKQIATVDGNQFAFSKVVQMKTTAYHHSEKGLTAFTATNLPVRQGIAAVDKSVIPLGTHLYVEGYGFAVAADVGGAVKGNTIDLYRPSLAQAINHGISYRKVYILE
jgi:3D (Asp-Asp-Asp) domain-containing protein